MKHLLILLSLISPLFAHPKVVLITGGNKGIGLAAAEAFHEQGWHVWAGYRSELPDPILKLNPLFIDVTDQQSIDRAVATVLAKEGHIDLLINNAGYGIIGPDETVSIEAAQHLFDVNYFGALRMIQAVTPTMRRQGSGHIINISSTSGVRALGGLGHYAASKFALEAISEALAITLSPWKIHVTLVEPGAVRNGWVDNCTRVGSEISLYALLSSNLYEKLKSVSQSGQPVEEIGKLLCDIAADPQPDMRYQTSDSANAVISKKLVDPTGNWIRDHLIEFMQSIL